MCFEEQMKFEMLVLFFSGGVPAAGGTGPAADESQAADEGQTNGQGCFSVKGLLGVFWPAGEGHFQTDVPGVPVCHLRTGSAHGEGQLDCRLQTLSSHFITSSFPVLDWTPF